MIFLCDGKSFFYLQLFKIIYKNNTNAGSKVLLTLCKTTFFLLWLFF